jgi:hypothetical protein
MDLFTASELRVEIEGSLSILFMFMISRFTVFAIRSLLSKAEVEKEEVKKWVFQKRKMPPVPLHLQSSQNRFVSSFTVLIKYA